MQSRCTLRVFCADQTGLEEVDRCAAMHLALDGLELGDLAFRLTV